MSDTAVKVETQEIDINKIFTEQLGVSLEEAKALKEESDKYKSISSEYESLKSQVPDYEARINKYEGNEFLKTIAQLSGEPDKLDTFLQLRNVDENISGLEAFKLRLKLEKGFSKSDIEDEVEVQLTKLGITDYDFADEEDKKKYDARINRTLAENKQWLIEQKKKLSTPVEKVDTKAEEAEIEKAASEFKNPFADQEVFASFETKTEDFTEEELIEAGLDKDIPLDYKFELKFDEELKKESEKLTKQLIRQGKFKNPEKNLQEIKDYVTLLVKGAMYDKHFAQAKKSIIFEASKRNKEYYAKKFSVGTERKPYAATETKQYGNATPTKKGGFVNPIKQ
jgi:hypothetical protein